jgi:hypothetical protein
MKSHRRLATWVAVALHLAVFLSVQAAESSGPFDPADAKVWDQDANHRFVWRDRCGNNSADHQLVGGFEWDRDSRGFLARGQGWVGSEYRQGLMMLAFPDANVLNAEQAAY